jgi:transcriptional regulator with XRE-family HTH domain
MPGFPASRLLGERVLAERIKLGINQQEFAHLAGLNVAHYGRIERGTGNPSMETLVRIAGAFGVDPGALVEGMTPDQLPPVKITYSAADFIRERERHARG